MRRLFTGAARGGALLLVLTLAGPVPTIAATAPPSPEGAAVLPESYPWVRLAETATPAVVNVRVRGQMQRMQPGGTPGVPEQFRRFLPPELRERFGERGPDAPRPQRRGIGSGFVIDPNGYVVTNHHVVDGAQTIDITLADGRTFPGKVVGIDPETDLALVKVEATGLPALKFGQSSTMKVGEPVMAIGNPFGLEHTVTVGIISGTSRVIGAGRYDDFLQTDAAINPGNSGGPLINTRGEVVGIATAIVSRSGGFQGVGFAIPADLAKPVLGQLRTAGQVTRGWLGVSIQPLTPELAKSFAVQGTEGVLVASVVEDSPAAKAGIKAGDLLLRYEDKAVSDPRALSSLVAGTPVGRTVEVQLVRDGKPQQLKVTIGNLADTRQAAAETPGGSRVAWDRLGVELAALTAERAHALGVEGRKGVVVTEVKPNSPAAEAGISAGDVIREVNRVPVDSLDDVAKGLTQTRDKQALLRVERQGGARYLVVEVA